MLYNTKYTKYTLLSRGFFNMNRTVETITFKVTEDTKKRLEEIAEEDRRPLSNLCRNIVLDWLEEHDKTPPKKSTKK